MTNIKKFVYALLAVVGLVCTINGTVHSVSAATTESEFTTKLRDEKVTELHRSGKQFYYNESTGFSSHKRVYVDNIMTAKEKATANKIINKKDSNSVTIDNGKMTNADKPMPMSTKILTVVIFTMLILGIIHRLIQIHEINKDPIVKALS